MNSQWQGQGRSSGRGLLGVFSFIWRAYRILVAILGDLRSAEMMRRQQRTEVEHRRVVVNYFENPQASGELGNAGLGDFDALVKAGLVNGGKGQWVGSYRGVALTYTGDKHRVVYGQTGAGKSATVRDAIAAGYVDGTPIFVEVKDGECAFVSAQYRKNVLGEDVTIVNFDELHGWKSVRVNPLYVIDMCIRRGKSPLMAALNIAHVLWPLSTRKGEDDWPQKGAQRLFCAWAIWVAWVEPADLTLSNAYLFGTQPEEGLIAQLEMIAASDAPGGAPQMAQTALSILLHAKKQWQGIAQSYCDALIYYAPGEPYGTYTAGMDVDFDLMRSTHSSAYIIANARNAEAAGPCVALVVNTFIEGLREARGDRKCLFIIDEFVRLPKIPALLVGIDNYRSRGISFVLFITSASSAIEKLGADMAANLERQAGVIQYLSFDDPKMLRDLEYMSGKKSVVVRGASANQSAVASASFGTHEVARALLQVDDLRRITVRQQLLVMPHQPFFIVDRIPWWEVDQWKGLLADARTLTPDTVLPPLDADDPDYPTANGDRHEH